MVTTGIRPGGRSKLAPIVGAVQCIARITGRTLVFADRIAGFLLGIGKPRNPVALTPQCSTHIHDIIVDTTKAVEPNSASCDTLQSRIIPLRHELRIGLVEVVESSRRRRVAEMPWHFSV